MRKIIFILGWVVLLCRCSANNTASKDAKKGDSLGNNFVLQQANQEDTVAKELVTIDQYGNYKEWYPGHKQLKKTGQRDPKGRRNGIWRYYSPMGVQLSLEMYSHGKRNGFTMTKYKNGAIHYTGNYRDDKKVGMWYFYNKKGEKTDSTNFDKQ